MQNAFGNQVVNPAAFGERRVQADAGLWPEEALCEVLVDALTNSRIADGDEAGDVSRIVGDQTVAEVEYVHGSSCQGQTESLPERDVSVVGCVHVFRQPS